MPFICEDVLIPEVAGKLTFNNQQLMKVIYDDVEVWSVTPFRIATLDILPVMVVGIQFIQTIISVSHTDKIVENLDGEGYIVEYVLDRKFSLAGGELPTGLTLDEDGVLSGIPEEEGIFTFEIKSEIVDGESDVKEFSVYVRPATTDWVVEFPILIETLMNKGRVFITEPSPDVFRYFIINGHLSEYLEIVPDYHKHEGSYSYIEPLTVCPSAPKITSITRGIDTLTIYWDRPELDGNVPILYQISLDGGTTWMIAKGQNEDTIADTDILTKYDIIVRGYNVFYIGPNSEPFISYPSIIATVIDPEDSETSEARLGQIVYNSLVDGVSHNIKIMEFIQTEDKMTMVLELTSLCDIEGHTFNEWSVIEEPTCTEFGEEQRSCSRCKYIESQEIIALGHIPGIAATCVEDQTCEVCNEILVSALGHSFGEWYIDGDLERRDCKLCDYYETQDISE